MPDPNAVGPAGRTFAQITGTDYLSDEERYWYLAQQGLGVDSVSGQVQSLSGPSIYNQTSGGGGGSATSQSTSPNPQVASSQPATGNPTADAMRASIGYNPNGTPITTLANASTNPGGNVNVQQGLPYIVQQQQMALERDVAVINNDAAMARQQISAASAEHVANINAQVQRDLQAGSIDASAAQQKIALAQQEAEFARTYALQKLEADRNWKIQQAQMAANPTNFVAYQMLKRGEAGGGDAGALANDFLGGGTDQSANTNPSGGEPGIPPPSSDSSIQQLVNGITGGGTAYSPTLQGTGAFGSKIVAPNQISRSDFNSMTPSDIGLYTSFLNAGVQTRPGDDSSRVAIPADDYWQQVQKSFVPTMAGAGASSDYAPGAGLPGLVGF